jgi:hypothetical protein
MSRHQVPVSRTERACLVDLPPAAIAVLRIPRSPA